MAQGQAKLQETESRGIQTHVVQPVRNERGKVHPTGKDHFQKVTGSIWSRQSSKFANK